MFTGFSAADFGAYEERKWSSNAFNLERMKVKDKVSHLLAVLQPLTGELSQHMSEEHPSIMNAKRVDSQWLYYCRTQAEAQDLARFLEKTELKPDKIFNLAPQEKHASLALVIDQHNLNIGLMVHPGAWVDRKNFAAKLDNSWDRERLLQILSALPTDIRIGFGDETLPAREMEMAAFESLAEMLRNDERRFVCWRTLSAAEAQAQGGSFVDTLKETFAPLVALYQFIAWSRQNDQIQVGGQLQKVKAEQRKNSTDFKIGDKVRVNGGLFAGKVGVISSIDTKQHVKVKVGPMSVNVPAQDLART
jgi:transcription antitermination factor NusG